MPCEANTVSASSRWGLEELDAVVVLIVQKPEIPHHTVAPPPLDLSLSHTACEFAVTGAGKL